MNPNETEQLAELIRRRHAALIGLRDLGQRQLELIEADQMGPLLTLLAGKQRLLGDLQTTERALDPFRRQDPAARQWQNPAEREHSPGWRPIASRCWRKSPGKINRPKRG